MKDDSLLNRALKASYVARGEIFDEDDPVHKAAMAMTESNVFLYERSKLVGKIMTKVLAELKEPTKPLMAEKAKPETIDDTGGKTLEEKIEEKADSLAAYIRVGEPAPVTEHTDLPPVATTDPSTSDLFPPDADTIDDPA